ncbi:MAG: hypothetical protein MRY83_08355 [Flavobacteriales bacterium]|nr:hypothetical protein [Flavobacteriales bacterium]
MVGFQFQEYDNLKGYRSHFERILDIFLDLLTHTSGDVEEALEWLRELDKEYDISRPDYSLDDFERELKERSYVEQGEDVKPKITAKTEKLIRERSLEQIFGKLKKGNLGSHRTNHRGKGDEITDEKRKYEYGDSVSSVDFTSSVRNAQMRIGLDNFNLIEDDLVVQENIHKTQTSTVLMIDISHSMILYGEDRITPAKKVAMALSELIARKYPKDHLDIVVFGNDAWQISVKDLPYLKVGPYHTNTVAGIELAMDLLRRRKSSNKQIFMITDGKPTCLKENGGYYQNSYGHDPKIINKTLNLAAQCLKSGIKITTFMIARDPYLQQFVEEFTEINKGKAFYSGLKGLGEFVFADYETNKRRRI